MDATKTAEKPRGRPFERGNQANPNGRPDGSRNKATLLLEKMMANDGTRVVQAVIDAAVKGDMQAARLVLDRICPPRKTAPIHLPLPPLVTAADTLQAMGVVVAAVGRGEISPDEGATLAGILEAKRRMIETADIEARLTKLERAAGGTQ